MRDFKFMVWIKKEERVRKLKEIYFKEQKLLPYFSDCYYSFFELRF